MENAAALGEMFRKNYMEPEDREAFFMGLGETAPPSGYDLAFNSDTRWRSAAGSWRSRLSQGSTGPVVPLLSKLWV